MGDPLIFGRGGEELETLLRGRHPLLGGTGGLPPLQAASAYSGIPLTHSQISRGDVRLITRPSEDRRRAGLGEPAVEKQTLVFYMGLRLCALRSGRTLDRSRHGCGYARRYRSRTAPL